MDYHQDLQNQYQKTLKEKNKTIEKLKAKLNAANVLLKTTETESAEKLATANRLLKSQSSLIGIYSRYENTHNDVNLLENECLQLKMSVECLTSQFEKQQTQSKNILRELGGAVVTLQQQATKLKYLNSINCLLSTQANEEIKYHQKDIPVVKEQTLEKHKTYNHAFTHNEQIQALEDQIYHKVFSKHDKSNKEGLNTIQKLSVVENECANFESKYHKFTELKNDHEIEHTALMQGEVTESFKQSNLQLIKITSKTSSQTVLKRSNEPIISLNGSEQLAVGVVSVEPLAEAKKQTYGTTFQHHIAKDIISETKVVVDKGSSPTTRTVGGTEKTTVKAELSSLTIPTYGLTKNQLTENEWQMFTPDRNSSTISVPQRKQHSAVMMVHGLHDNTLNADKLFNLVSLYGNVAKITFLKSSKGSSMVEMGDSDAVRRCVQYLNKVPLGSNGKLEIKFSRKQFLNSEVRPFTLPDRSVSYKDYTTSKKNRFLSPAEACKNRILSPSKILYFCNTPPTLKETQLLYVLDSRDVIPEAVHIFPLRSDEMSSGLIEFKSVGDAVLAVMKCNNLLFEDKGQQLPFNMQLNFTTIKNTGNINRRTQKNSILYHFYQH